MTGLTRIRLAVLSSGLGDLVLSGAAWADHPAPGGRGPWAWLGLLLAALVVALIWPVLAFLERRQTPPSQRRREPKS